MGRVVAISGGELDTTEKLNIYALKLSGKESQNVLFIGTASMDSDGYFAGIKTAFGKLNCNVKELPLTKGELNTAEIDSRLEWADVIYVGGGDTRMMMEIWKQHSLDKKLKEIYENDTAVLTALSAGAICWFLSGQQFIIESRQDAKAWLFSDHTKKELEVIPVEKMVP